MHINTIDIDKANLSTVLNAGCELLSNGFNDKKKKATVIRTKARLSIFLANNTYSRLLTCNLSVKNNKIIDQYNTYIDNNEFMRVHRNPYSAQ